MNLKNNLNSKNVIITGAGGDIGINLVKEFLNNNNKVLAISRNIDTLNKLSFNKNLFLINSDFCNVSSFKKIKKYLFFSFKNIDILINNAGCCIYKPFSKMTMKDFKTSYEVNLFSCIRMIKLVYKIMNKNGHIINICSMGSIYGSVKFNGLSAYTSSKAALCSLTEILAQEFILNNIFVNALALGSVDTKMFKRIFPNINASFNKKELAKYIFEFSLNGNKFFNGKIIPVSISTP